MEPQSRMKLRAHMTLLARPKSDTNHVAGISPEKVDQSKKAWHREAETKSNKINIHINSEQHQEKAGYTPVRRNRKCPATQDPQDKLRILQH
jgi:hypothetical protein